MCASRASELRCPQTHVEMAFMCGDGRALQTHLGEVRDRKGSCYQFGGIPEALEGEDCVVLRSKSEPPTDDAFAAPPLPSHLLTVLLGWELAEHCRDLRGRGHGRLQKVRCTFKVVCTGAGLVDIICRDGGRSSRAEQRAPYLGASFWELMWFAFVVGGGPHPVVLSAYT